MTDDADDASEPTHQPKAGAKVEPRGYFLRVDFAPAVTLQRKGGFRFAERLSDYFDLKDCKIDDGRHDDEFRSDDL